MSAMFSGQTLLMEDGYDGGELSEKASKFADDWSDYTGSELSQFQNHFNALCHLAGHDTPGDRVGSRDFAFNRVTPKADGGHGEADVFLKDRFVMEYKRAGRSLDDAYYQALSYRDSLGNPPLILVSDFQSIRIHTNFTGTVSEVFELAAEDFANLGGLVKHHSALGDESKGPQTVLEVLRACFHSPEELKPIGTPEDLTLRAAETLRAVVDHLLKLNRNRDVEIARFLSQALFTMFASDIGLLQDAILSEATKVTGYSPSAEVPDKVRRLFEKMSEGERDGTPPIPRFNGGLFDGTPPKLEGIDAVTAELQAADKLDWSQVDPTVFGTMFERVFNPEKRSQFGMFYTSRSEIEQLAEPVLMAPLRTEWEGLKQRLGSLNDDDAAAIDLQQFVDRLGEVKVLDPACGSGNFLYVALSLLDGLEREVIAWALSNDLIPPAPRVHPRQLYGIELDRYAQQLAIVVIWIGHLQNNKARTEAIRALNPILEPLDNVECRDAIFSAGGAPAIPDWPECDVIIGNPPFLGNKFMRREMGSDLVVRLYRAWDGAVPNGADLCMYWFEKARQQIEAGRAKRAGLLGTQGIRGTASLKVLQRIHETGGIFFAVSDQMWRQYGPKVKISMVGFDDGSEIKRELDGRGVDRIHADLTSRIVDVTQANPIPENAGIAFQGLNRRKLFEISNAQAKDWMPNGTDLAAKNAQVLKPLVTGDDLVGVSLKRWLVDFPPEMDHGDAMLYWKPYEYLRYEFDPDGADDSWWELRPKALALRAVLAGLDRYIAISRVSKHRIFVWIDGATLPDSSTVVFATDSDRDFGILQSDVHRVWAEAKGTQVRDKDSGFRYTHRTCFEQFPFPHPAAESDSEVAMTARGIIAARSDWMKDMTEDAPHDRRRATLTNLYNEMPAGLRSAHAKLDRAVYRAYGWSEVPGDLSEDEVLSRLLALNLERTAKP